ncbi:hypothetical protein Z043_122306 [Scleropages formosus]|uniref:Uncharacterized protein n=1 Tax=Scleropages formosus TaxID=113540 RepID=A0A0P7TFZ7_SCLFO|nr:hypothetical protein Z043_122306 [Scleropages formosus]
MQFSEGAGIEHRSVGLRPCNAGRPPSPPEPRYLRWYLSEPPETRQAAAAQMRRPVCFRGRRRVFLRVHGALGPQDEDRRPAALALRSPSDSG